MLVSSVLTDQCLSVRVWAFSNFYSCTIMYAISFFIRHVQNLFHLLFHPGCSFWTGPHGILNSLHIQSSCMIYFFAMIHVSRPKESEILEMSVFMYSCVCLTFAANSANFFCRITYLKTLIVSWMSNKRKMHNSQYDIYSAIRNMYVQQKYNLRQ